MSSCTRALLLGLALPFTGALASASTAHAQVTKKPKDAAKANAKATPDTTPKKPKVSKLFKSEAPLDVTFTANFRALRKETQDKAPWHAATITYTDSTGKAVRVPLRVRTRGVWRLNNCDFPPLRLNFANRTSKATLFDDLDEPKLVSWCKSGSEAEKYVLQELQMYRIYQRLTPIGHQTRLLRMTYVDSATGKPELTRYAFLVEDPARMAERVGGRIVDRKGAGPDDLHLSHSALVFLYQYLIGNTDFSFSTLHNAELLAMSDGQIFPVAYDFDFAGAINPPYARPAPGLRIRTVRERQFRGYCAIRAEYASVLPHFESKKAAIYALYSDTVGMLIDRKTAASTLSYFDDFYQDVATPKELARTVLSDCSDQK